jgi:hypothetical protein
MSLGYFARVVFDKDVYLNRAVGVWYGPRYLSCFFEAVAVSVSWRRQLKDCDTKGRVIGGKPQNPHA